MSADQTEAVDRCCASCGKAEVDDVKLMDCDGCDLVKYCSDNCKEDHRLQHEVKCKERKAELRDRILFRQLESSHLGDCPICCLPLPIDPSKSGLQTCCSKLICKGCMLIDTRRQWEANRQLPICAFCRQPLPNDEEVDKNLMKRIAANDAAAMSQMGFRHYGRENLLLHLNI